MIDEQGHKWLTIPTFCDSIDNVLSQSFVRRLAGQRKIESVKVGERKWLIRSDALELLRAQQQEG